MITLSFNNIKIKHVRYTFITANKHSKDTQTYFSKIIRYWVTEVAYNSKHAHAYTFMLRL